MHRTISGQENITYSSLTPPHDAAPSPHPRVYERTSVRAYERTLMSQLKFLGWMVYQIFFLAMKLCSSELTRKRSREKSRESRKLECTF